MKMDSFAWRRTGFVAGAVVVLRHAALLLLLAVFFFLVQSRAVGVYDEAFTLTAALRVLHGQVIHRDFYYAYGPAQLYLLAGVFRLFGTSLLAARLLHGVLTAALILLLHGLVRTCCGRGWSLAATVTTALWCVGLNLRSTVVTPTACLLLLATMQLLCYKPARGVSAWLLFGVGVADACVFLFRYDIGCVFVLLHVGMVAMAMRSRGEQADATGVRWSDMLALPAGVAVVLALPVTLFVRAKGLRDFVFDLWTYPLLHYRNGRALPFPAIRWRHPEDLLLVLPCVVLVVGAMALLWMGRERRFARQPVPQGLAGLLLSVALLYAKAYIRISPLQVFLCVVFCVAVLAVLLQYRKGMPRMLGVTVVGVALLFAGGVFFGAVQEVRALRRTHASVLEGLLAGPRSNAEKAWCAERNTLTLGMCFLPPIADRAVIPYLQSRLRAGDTLYAGLRRHDRVLANDNLPYFATEHLPATRWSQFDPGLQNSAGIQRLMVADLTKTQPALVVRDAEFEGEQEPNESSLSSGVVLLDDWLDRNYRAVEQFGTLTVMQRMDGTGGETGR